MKLYSLTSETKATCVIKRHISLHFWLDFVPVGCEANETHIFGRSFFHRHTPFIIPKRSIQKGRFKYVFD